MAETITPVIIPIKKIYNASELQGEDGYIGYSITTSVGKFILKITAEEYNSCCEEISKYCSHPLELLKYATLLTWTVNDTSFIPEIIKKRIEEAEKVEKIFSALTLVMDVTFKDEKEITKVWFFVANCHSGDYAHHANFILERML